MKYVQYLVLFLIFSLSLCHKTNNANAIFTELELNSLTRLSQTVVSSDGKYAIYVIRNWFSDTGKINNHIEYKEIFGNNTGILTTGQNYTDTNPATSEDIPHTVFFLSTRSGSSQIWTADLPDTASTEPPVATQLTNFPIDINSFKISKNGKTIVFAAEVYNECEPADFKCTYNKDQEIESRGPNTYQSYTQLLIRHWDHWNSDKVSHIFALKLNIQEKIENGRKLKIPVPSGNPVDLMKGLKANSPVGPFGGPEMYDVSPDGSEVAFTAADRSHDEAWNTGWKTYKAQVGDSSVVPDHFTNHTKARTTQPKYTLDGAKIGFLSMDRPGLESDKLHLEIYDRATKTRIDVTGGEDISIIDYAFSSESNIVYYTSTQFGVNRLLEKTIPSKINNKFLTYLEDDKSNIINPKFEDDDIHSSGIPIHIPHTKQYLIERISFTEPTDIWIFDSETKNLSRVTNVNPKLKDYSLITPDTFKYKGFNNDDVQGWVFKPIDFDDKKKYPLALLIHGGPEASWSSTFSSFSNAQIFTNRGYATVMLNPHGSTGQGQKYTDSIRNDWGGAPYKDILFGMTYLETTYQWIDTKNACAVGGSFGGYMVNWIQGQTDIFKCLVNHDGVFSHINMFYATDELWFPMAENCPIDQVGCTPYDGKNRDGYFKHSPESFVDNWKTPELVIHGSLDFRIPMSEAVSTFTALQLKGIPSRFLHFTEEGHGPRKPENYVKWYQEVLGWLDKWTAKKP